MKRSLQLLASDLFQLFFPSLCVACDERLADGEDTLCLFCEFGLPRTYFHRKNDNPVARHFWGRVRLQYASSFLVFEKGGKVQQVLTRLKYKGMKQVGLKIGRMYASELIKDEAEVLHADLILPIPLHQTRKQVRGYNQSALFAAGFSEVSGIPWDEQHLIRRESGESQTGKDRYERWLNVEGAFTVEKADELSGKQVIVVDDVMTTGATLESAVQALNQSGVDRVSILTMAAAGV